jgi:hypothetical protein
VAWGLSESAEASRIWNDELAALGLPPEPEMIANHALLDAPEKIASLLGAAGFANARGWRRRFERRADREEWLSSQLAYASRRRLAALAEAERSAFADRLRTRTASLGPEAFVHRPEAVFALAYTAADPIGRR